MITCPRCDKECVRERVSDVVTRWDCPDCELYPPFHKAIARDLRAVVRGFLPGGRDD